MHIIYLYDDDECEPSFHCFPNKNHHKYQWDADDNRHGSEAGDDEADDNGHDDDDDGHYGEADDDGHDDNGHDDDGHDDDGHDDDDYGGESGDVNLRLISTPICLRWLLSRISCLFTNS